MTQIKKTMLKITILSFLFFANCNDKIHENPIVKWTAQLPDTTKTNLGFDILQNMQTAVVYKANPETGT